MKRVKKLVFSKLFLLILIGLSLRVVIMISTVHSDLRGPNFGGYLISQKAEVLTFYDYMSHSKDSHLIGIYGVDLFIYPPLLYLTSAFFMKVFSFLYPWELFRLFINNMDIALKSQKIYLLLFLLKAPFLIFDFLGLVLIGKLFIESKKIFLARVFWLFNPVLIYSAYMMGQFDILIAFFILLSIYLFGKKRKYLSVATLGLGGLVKMFPLLLLPFLAFYNSDKRKSIKLLLLGVFVYFIGISPFLFSPGFRNYALLASQSDKMFYAKILVSGGEGLPIFVVFYVLFFLILIYKKFLISLSDWFLIVLLLFFSITHFHPNWFIWISAPLILFLVRYWPKSVFPTTILLACYLFIVFLFDSSLNFGLFRIVFPGIENISFSHLLSKFYNPNEFGSLIRGIFAGTSIFLIFFLNKNKDYV